MPWHAPRTVPSARQLLTLYRVCLALLLSLYLVCAVVHDASQAAPLVALTSLVVAYTVGRRVCVRWAGQLESHCVKPCGEALRKHRKCIKWLCIIAVAVAVVLYLAIDVGLAYRQLVSMAGYVILLLLLFVTSKHPAHVNWRPVFWGLELQFLLAIINLRTRLGLQVFRYLGDRMQAFLSYADAGSKFMFGEEHYTDHLFAFRVLPVIVFFSCVISTLYYLGLMQAVIAIIAWLMQVPAEHLICASVMNAPTALAVSKLTYPETRSTRPPTNILTEKSKERNFLEAASAGASASIKLVANIAANLIAFLALLAFINALLASAGGFIGYPWLSFQWLCAHAFLPVAVLMGVEWRDCGHVAELLGIKTFLNEFVAYEELAKLIANRKACLQPALSVRSETLVAYALCGFAILSSIGIQLGTGCRHVNLLSHCVCGRSLDTGS